MTVIGCDISFWQDDNSTPQQVDFRKMKRAGAEFVFIKASQELYQDQDFDYNWRGAKAAGLLRGAYHFYDYRSSPAGQAEKLAGLLKNDAGELPSVLDLEAHPQWELPSREVLLANMFTYTEQVRRMTARAPIFYSNPAMIHYLKPIPTWLFNLRLWIAHYGVNEPDYEPWADWTFWQWGTPARGAEFGCESKEIDMNYFSGSIDDLYALAGGVKPVEENKPMASKWTTNALGLDIDQRHTVNWSAVQTGADFVIALAGEGTSKNTAFAGHVDGAAKAVVPLLAAWRPYPQAYVETGKLGDPSRWPTAEIETLAKALEFKTYNGIVIDVRNTVDPVGKPFDGQWLAETTRFVAEAAAKIAKAKGNLPVLIRVSEAVVKTAQERWIGVLKDYPLFPNFSPFAVEGQYNTVGTTLAELRAKYLPADTFRFSTSEEPGSRKNPPVFVDGKNWSMWHWSPGKFFFPEVSGALVGLSFYNGDRARLRDFLKFTVSEPADPGDENDGGGGEDGDTGGGSVDLARLERALVAGAEAFLAKMRE